MCLLAEIYKKQFVKRYDKQEHISYFTHLDFDSLKKDDISFKSAQGTTLNGGLYYYDGYDNDILVIFCHGMGCGHLSYMKEIEMLCKNGFLVLSYDITGCDLSEGKDIRCMAQSISDLNSCLDYVADSKELCEKRLFIVGHSWGAYAAGNILNYRDNIEKVVEISGFASTGVFLRQYFKGALEKLIPFVIKYERKCCPKFAESCFVDAFNKTNAKVLAIQSDDDAIVSISSGIGYIRDKVNNENVKYIVTTGKVHNPNYTEDAVKYMGESFGALNEAIKAKKVKTVDEKKEFFKDIDWDRMTKQDEKIWDEIIAFLKV